MTTQITYEKTAGFVRTVKRCHFARLTRKNFLAYLPIGIVGLLGVLGSLHNGKSGGVFWLFIGISVLWPVLWALHYSATSYIRLADPAPRFTAQIEPNSITITSAKSSSTLEWSAFRAMWKFPDVILLFRDKKCELENSIALPTALLGVELGKYIEDKVREHGGRVSGPSLRMPLDQTQRLPPGLRVVAGYFFLILTVDLLLPLFHSGARPADFESKSAAYTLGAKARPLIFDSLYAACGVGLLCRQRWARKLGLFVLPAGAYYGAYGFAWGFAHGRPSPSDLLVSFVIIDAWTAIWFFLLYRKSSATALR